LQSGGNVKEGGLHHTTPQTTAMHELAERLHSASRNWQWAEGGEGNVSDGGDNKHVNGLVRGLHWVDTGDGRWWKLRGNSDNDGDIEEGRPHPTQLMTAPRKLAARLRSAGISYASEASLSDVDKRERTTMTTSNGPPNDDEEGGNVGKLWAHATVFF